MRNQAGIMIVVLWALGAPVCGQYAEPIRAISRANLREYERLLELSDEQVQIGEVLHEGYMQALQRENVEFREAMAAAERAQSGSLEMRSRAHSRHVLKNLSLQDQFFADLRAMLETSQREAFPRVERMRLRQLILRNLQLAWSQVDLVECLAQVSQVAYTDELEEAVIRYELAMDRPLQEQLDSALEVVKNEEPVLRDQARMLKTMEEFFDLMHGTRAINKRHARVLGSLMDESMRVRFEHQARATAFPKVYTRSRTTAAFETALGLADLTAEQAASVEELHERYARELESANGHWAQAIDEQAERMDFKTLLLAPAAGTGDEESKKAEAARYALDDRYRERLEELLSSEQVERLPMSREAERLGQERLMQAQEDEMQRELERRELERRRLRG